MNREVTWVCTECNKLLGKNEIFKINKIVYCREHYIEANNKVHDIKHKLELENGPREELAFNEPDHYHKHEIDTIAFLQRGFSPEVFAHFCTANIIKYAQRYPYKNGRDDLLKIVDYAKRLLDWHDEQNPSK